jgi:YD repeat-containing protein
VTTYSYDAWGRLVGIDYPHSADVSLQYDAEGRLTQAVDGTGTRTFEYDSWGRRVRQTAPVLATWGIHRTRRRRIRHQMVIQLLNSITMRHKLRSVFVQLQKVGGESKCVTFTQAERY